MTMLCQRLNLTCLPAQLPTVLEAARLQQLSSEAFGEAALRAELAGRQQRAQARRFRAARLPFPARLDRFDFCVQPSVSKRLINALASLTFLQTATNVVFLGPPGVGKPHVACGVAVQALVQCGVKAPRGLHGR